METKETYQANESSEAKLYRLIRSYTVADEEIKRLERKMLDIEDQVVALLMMDNVDRIKAACQEAERVLSGDIPL